jgi:uncharacterized membrane protein
LAEHLSQTLSQLFAPEIVVMILSALPISEVRGGIPYGLAMAHLPLWKVLVLAMSANVVSVVPVILFFNWAAERLAEAPLLGRVLGHMLKKARSKEELVNKYGVWAVTLFVAIPLPFTGAWTGATVAAVFGMNFWRAVGCMVVGVIIAGTIVTLLTCASMNAYDAVAIGTVP